MFHLPPHHSWNGDPPMVLNKQSATATIQSELEFPRRQAAQTIESLIEILKSPLESGEDFW